MARILHLAPIGTGKTDLVLSLLEDVAQRQHALPKVWVLLATRRQELSFRQRLIERNDSIPVYFNIEFFNFYTLNARLLKIAGEPVRRLNNLTRHGLLRRLLAQMLQEGQLGFFHRIAETRGFVSILAQLFDELKQAGVDVEDFAAAAHSAKDKEIAAIYRRYQATLIQSGLADVEGEGWLALARLRARSEIASEVDLLLVDGYDQFTLVQAQLLAELSRTIKQVHLTLTDIPDVHAHALPHRSLLARARLTNAYAEAGIVLKAQRVEPRLGERQRDLERLGQLFFRVVQPEAGGDAIRLIAMPDPAEEVKTVLRAVRSQLLGGVQPDDILIALRDWDRYATHFESGAGDYELPLLLHYERSFNSIPVIAALIDLLQLAPRFRRRNLLDTLRSPYVDAGLDAELIDLLDRISMEQQFLGGGKSDWLEIIQLAGQQATVTKHDVQFTALTQSQADELKTRLTAFFDGVTPPKHADIRSYIRWLIGLLGSDPRADPEDGERKADENPYTLNIIMRAWDHEYANAAIVQRDISALNGMKGILRDLLSSDDVLRTTFGQAADVSWRQFSSDLKHALETTADDPFNFGRNGQVLVTTASEARGLPHQHVYIVGLAEGVFPAEVSEDPLYLDSEREVLQERGIPMATQAERIDDQGLFYELISLPRETLTLSRPTYKAGKVWIESHLWRAVTRVFPELPIESRAVGSVIHPAEAANSSEVMLAIADQLNEQDVMSAESALSVMNWLPSRDGYAEQWRHISCGRSVELGRLSDSPFDRFSGILSHPDLVAEVARRLGDNRVWSASRLKDYGLCGFRYFAKRLLRLEEVKEPEPGFDAAQLGLLNHRILEDTYRKIRERALSIHEGNLSAALEIFTETALDLLDAAPYLFNFRATATWHEEKQVLLNRLVAMIKQDFSPDSPLSKFGDSRCVHDLETEFNDVEIDMPPGMKPIRVTGYIDRIDNVDGKLVVVDYKSGSTPISRQEMEIGRDFQMMIYVLALTNLFEKMETEEELAGGLFWHLRNLKASGVYSADNEDDDAALELAREHIARNLQHGRDGQFPIHATALEDGKCARFCEFSHFCRMHVTGRHKTLARS